MFTAGTTTKVKKNRAVLGAPPNGLPPKRIRKTVARQSWTDSEEDSENDPYSTDETDEWAPSSSADTSQDLSQSQDF